MRCQEEEEGDHVPGLGTRAGSTLLFAGPDLGGGNRGGCPGPTAFEGAPMVLIIMIFMLLFFVYSHSF